MQKHIRRTASACSSGRFHLRLVPRVLEVDGNSLTVEDVLQVASKGIQVVFSEAARQRINASRAVLENAAARGQQIYGMNTQLGPYATRMVADDDVEQFQITTVVGHSLPLGAELDSTTVRAMILARINGFARGTSGICLSTAEALVSLLNAGVHPIVVSGCSVGQSDLSEMAQIAMVLIGLGQAEYRGRRLSGREALSEAGLNPVALAGKEGLSLISANGLTLGRGSLVLAKATVALQALNLGAAMSLEGFGGNLSILHPAASRAKPHAGHVAIAIQLRKLLVGSALWNEGAQRNMQDPLSFRCMPHIHGAVHDSISQLKGTLETELNSGCDNPMVSIVDDAVISVGNFDMTSVAIGFDALRISLVHGINIANERIQKMMWSDFTGLPTGLEQGANGLTRMIPLARAAAALAAEARALANPVSLTFVAQIGEGIEDYASMAPLAVKQTDALLELIFRIASLEVLIATQAIALRNNPELGTGTRRAIELLSRQTSGDATNWIQQIEELGQALASGRLFD